MFRVKTVYWMRRVAHSPTIKLVALFVLAVVLASYVSFSHIIANMTASVVSLEAFAVFTTSAFVKTRVIVQLLSLVSLSLVGWMLRDIVENIRHIRLVGSQN